MSAPGDEIRLVAVQGPQPEPSMWPALAVAFVLLVMAALFAHHRSTALANRSSSRRARILWSSLACGVGVTLVLAADEIAALLLAAPQALAALGFGIAAGTVLAALLFGSADLMLDAFRPRRSLAWLCIGPLLLTLYGVGFLAASEWLDGFDAGPAGPAPLGAVLAAALVWWSLLPAAGRESGPDVAAIFE